MAARAPRRAVAFVLIAAGGVAVGLLLGRGCGADTPARPSGLALDVGAGAADDGGLVFEPHNPAPEPRHGSPAAPPPGARGSPARVAARGADGGAAPSSARPDWPPPARVSDTLVAGDGGGDTLAAALVRADEPGAIDGTVSLVGPAPERRPQHREADPVCARTPALDEEALVDGGLVENAVVLLEVDGLPPVPAPADPLVVRQRGCSYSPHVAVAAPGQQLRVENADATLHNVHAFVGASTVLNRGMPPRAEPVSLALGPGITRLRCDVHPWMRGYVLAYPTPFRAVTDAAGHFAFPAVPAGTHRMLVWHERFGEKRARVVVKAGRSTPIAVGFQP